MSGTISRKLGNKRSTYVLTLTYLIAGIHQQRRLVSCRRRVKTLNYAEVAQFAVLENTNTKRGIWLSRIAA